MKRYFNIQDTERYFKGTIEDTELEGIYKITETSRGNMVHSYMKDFPDDAIKKELKHYFGMPNGRVRFYS